MHGFFEICPLKFKKNFFVQVFFTYDSDLNPGLCSEHQSYQACNRCIQNLYKTLADCQNSCQNGPLEPTLRAKRGKNSLAVEARHIQNLYRENEYHQIYKRIDTVETPATKTTTTPITTTSTKSVLNLATNNNNFIVQNSNDGIWNDECYDASGGSSSDSGSISGSRPRIDSDELSEIVQQPSSGSDTDSDFVHYKPSYRAYQKNRAGYKQMMKDGSFDGMVKRSPKMFTKRLRL